MDKRGIEKALLDEIAMLPVDIPTNRRPVIFDRLISVGLRSVRIGMSPEDIGEIKRALVRRIVEIFDRFYGARITELEDRVAELERQLKDRDSDALVLLEDEISRLRTYHGYGMKVSELATLFGISAADVRKALKGKGRVRL
jgi:hypothetical protein